MREISTVLEHLDLHRVKKEDSEVSQRELRLMPQGKHVVLSVAILSLALIICTAIVARPLDTFVSARKSLAVTGSAKKQITSDLAVWQGQFSRRSPDMQTAYAGLRQDQVKVRQYLQKEGIPDSQVVFSAVYTEPQHDFDPKTGRMSSEVVAYVLRQNVEVRSGDVNKIAAISRESTELINQGVMFQSFPVQFFYTKLNDLKVEMLAEASRDAQARAEKIVAATGGRLGHLKSARMGVFQITRLHSNEVSDYGINDTSSLEKEITAVVNAEFSIR